MEFNITESKVGNEVVQTISGREIFHALGGHPGSFSGWIAYRVKKHGFKSDIDYITSIDESYYGQKDYHVTLAMAATMARDGGYKHTDVVASSLESLAPKLDTAADDNPHLYVFSPPSHLSGVDTISSVDLVGFINNLRDAGRAQLRHDHLLKKIGIHPGFATSNYLGTYKDSTGRSNPCYFLPEREAYMMVMDDGRDVQAKIMAHGPDCLFQHIRQGLVKVPVVTVPAHLLGVKTMTSLDIVDVINQLRPKGKALLTHADFMKKLVNHPGINAGNFSGVYLGGNGEHRTCYYLPKREAELMVMSESLEVQTKVYDRLAEMEQRQVAPTFQLPASYSEALFELAATVQKVEVLQIENKVQGSVIVQQSDTIKEQQPSVDFVEGYVESDGTCGFRVMAKLLGANEREFRNFLADRKYMYQVNKVWTHYAIYGEKGNGTFVEKTGYSKKTGQMFTASYFTPKGSVYITGKWNERKPVLTREAKLRPDIAKLAK